MPAWTHVGGVEVASGGEQREDVRDVLLAVPQHLEDDEILEGHEGNARAGDLHRHRPVRKRVVVGQHRCEDLHAHGAGAQLREAALAESANQLRIRALKALTPDDGEHLRQADLGHDDQDVDVLAGPDEAVHSHRDRIGDGVTDLRRGEVR